MTKKYNLIKFINQLVACEPRLGRNLIKAEELIAKALTNHGLKSNLQLLLSKSSNSFYQKSLINHSGVGDCGEEKG